MASATHAAFEVDPRGGFLMPAMGPEAPVGPLPPRLAPVPVFMATRVSDVLRTQKEGGRGFKVPTISRRLPRSDEGDSRWIG